MNILSIDPGSSLSAYCVLDESFHIQEFGKVENKSLLSAMFDIMKERNIETVVLERVASYGMPVGREVFDTCEWIGRFTQVAYVNSVPVEYVYRSQEKLAICHSTKATDATIRHALIDRFAQHDKRTGKGTKSNPDFFYGFKADCWQAFAVGVTYLERINNNEGCDSHE